MAEQLTSHSKYPNYINNLIIVNSCVTDVTERIIQPGFHHRTDTDMMIMTAINIATGIIIFALAGGLLGFYVMALVYGMLSARTAWEMPHIEFDFDAAIRWFRSRTSSIRRWPARRDA